MSDGASFPKIQVKLSAKGNVEYTFEDDIVMAEIRSNRNMPDYVSIQISDQAVGKSSSGSKKMEEIGKDLEFNTKIEVHLGAEAKDLERVFLGKLTGLSSSSVSGVLTINLIGMNELHDLARSSHQKTYTDRTVQQIVEDIAGAYHLKTDFGKKQPSYKYKSYVNNCQNDLMFLKILASRHDRSLWVSANGENNHQTLNFKTFETDETHTVVLDYNSKDENILQDFCATSNASKQVTRIIVHCWNPADKKEFVGESKDNATKQGPAVGAKSYGVENELRLSLMVQDKEEAELIAKSIHNERKMQFVTGSLTTKGNTKIKIGNILKIVSENARYKGNYYIAGVCHRFSHERTNNGFTTEVEFLRDADMCGGK